MESFSRTEAAALTALYAQAALRNFIEAEELACRAAALREAGMAILERATFVASHLREDEPPEPDTGDNIAF